MKRGGVGDRLSSDSTTGGESRTSASRALSADQPVVDVDERSERSKDVVGPWEGTVSALFSARWVAPARASGGTGE